MGIETIYLFHFSLVEVVLVGLCDLAHKFDARISSEHAPEPDSRLRGIFLRIVDEIGRHRGALLIDVLDMVRDGLGGLEVFDVSWNIDGDRGGKELVGVRGLRHSECWK